MKFSEKLRRLMVDRKATAFSRRAGLPPTAISNYISKGQTPRADTALRLAWALGVSLEWLVDDEKDWPPVWSNAQHAAEVA